MDIIVITAISLFFVGFWEFIVGIIEALMECNLPKELTATGMWMCFVGIPVATSLIYSNWWNLLCILTTIFGVWLLDKVKMWENAHEFGKRLASKAKPN